MQIEDWPIAEVRPYPNNPRVLRNAAEKVAESIRAFGWRQPIVVDEQGVIIIGHSRLAAAKLLKLDAVPVHVARGLSDAQVLALRVADNKTAEFSTWDDQKLAAKRGPDGWSILTDCSSEVGIGRLAVEHARRIDGERFVLGHCRLATVPGTKHPRACQPIVVGRFAVAHNGTVANVADLQRAFGFALRSGNDSEAIAHLLNILPGSVDARIDATLATIDHGGHYALSVIDLDQQAVFLRAACMPLWAYRGAEGLYWCSIRPGEEWEGIRGPGCLAPRRPPATRAPSSTASAASTCRPGRPGAAGWTT